MADSIISAENLGKRYKLRHLARKPSTSLREAITYRVNRLAARLRSGSGRKPAAAVTAEEFWALQGVNFEIARGDVVGIIGRNGAGKSTLLKILSRITEPTEGRIRLRGRVASLLEVGTGFHPELTGRENIFLNGAILGMTKTEISSKFDEIVAFSEVEKFLDTPVKHYSSGMYVRLAFAVAAHLEPEILIVDEVLAVGDAQFQQKCLGKMKDVASGGRTVLFVSHSMSAVQSLCNTGILLESGRVTCCGDAAETIKRYSSSTKMNTEAHFPTDPTRPSITHVSVDQPSLDQGTLLVKLGFRSPFPLSPPVGGLLLSSQLGTPVYGSNCRFHNEGFGQPKASEGILEMRVDNLPVYGDTYSLSVWLGDWQTDYDSKRDVLAFDFKHGHRPPLVPNPEITGFVATKAHWTFAPS